MSYPVTLGNTEVHIANADGSNPQIIITDGNTASADPVLSPDGKYIAFVSNQDGPFKIYIMNRDGSDQHRLTQLEPYDSPDLKDQIHPAWSSDDDTLAFLSEGKTDSEIMLASVDSSPPHVLVGNVAPQLPFDWSPDGRSITYSSKDQAQLCLINVETKSHSCLSDFSNITIPRWSPDGRSIVFAASHKEGYDLYVFEVATNKVQELTDNSTLTDYLVPANYDAVWSPSGRQLSFDSGDNFVIPGGMRPTRIYVIDADGSNLKPLTDNNSRNYSPSWQP